jgi:2'-hydroxyisoflavone reductase
MLEHGLSEWEAVPWWVPPAELAFSRFDASRALEAGLSVRPIEESFRDCWAWDRTRAGEPLRSDRGLAPEREAELLEAWHRRGPG